MEPKDEQKRQRQKEQDLADELMLDNARYENRKGYESMREYLIWVGYLDESGKRRQSS